MLDRLFIVEFITNLLIYSIIDIQTTNNNELIIIADIIQINSMCID